MTRSLGKHLSNLWQWLLKNLDKIETYLLGFILASYVLTLYLPRGFLVINKVLFVLYATAFVTNCFLRPKMRPTIYTLLALVWLAFKLLSVFQYGWNEIVSLHLVSVVGFAMLFCLVSTRTYSKKGLLVIVKIVLIPIFLLSVLTIFFNEPFQGLYESRRVLTIFGTQTDPNNLAAYYCYGFLFSLYFAMTNAKRNKVYFLFLVPAVTCFYSCYLTGSRSGLICLLLMLILGFSLFGSSRLRTVLLKFAIIVVASVAAFLLLLAIKPDLIADYYFRFVQAFKDGGSGRLQIWKTDLGLLYTYPVFGGGWGSATYYGKIIEKAAHNTFLSMLVENGFVGSFPFVLLLSIAVCRSIRDKKYLQFLALLCMSVSAFFLDAINKPFLWLGLICGCFDLGTTNLPLKSSNLGFYRVRV